MATITDLYNIGNERGDFNRISRLAKDFEFSISSAENYVMIAHSMLLLNRLANHDDRSYTPRT